MKFESMLLQMKDRMPERRFIHTRGVAETATQLAAKYGEDIEKAEIAGILHDSVKYAEKSWLKEIIISEQMDPMLLNFHHELWHAPVGSYVARQEFNIEDADILNAIQYHTTGRAGMSNLEKIVYIADMIEPSRSFPGVEVLREIANQDLEEGMLSCVQHSMTFLIKKRQPVFSDSFHCYNDLIQKRGKVKE
ncbi:bis(5'-nucleosyl)-tetraphosphatase (symmetrical) YqeK [Psychrobacillus sp. MER TA 171]|uniref:bis(5'-nucleosyl)-tetraphosphatase (symmetrical) YqeK n=1 Tax=Psychrobacillus sp. MER TA 171 TaxID=2939577 RepID=UPI002040A55F|nr:bis(5'-nucleosyl)-tetraphosphatase (symmetrical) YqeK [Psychrobacillus sp. MER TA 171]MCM3358434.1 bis(5'-nucleosyl)-tetraphosphatase (symmetrical) YqeK [Psychrobacillus sp. MER TA 171]